MIDVYSIVWLVVLGLPVCLTFAAIFRANHRMIAMLGAILGAVATVGVVVVFAFLVYVAFFFASGGSESFGRGHLAGYVIFVSAGPAFMLGLFGCAIGAMRGARWRPTEPVAPDNWSAPDIAEVQRVVTGFVTKRDIESK